MFDLSPEKILVLLAIGLVVLGPQRLPSAARALALGLARARRLASTLTQPVYESVAEPRRTVEEAIAGVRDVVQRSQTPASTNYSASQHSVPPSAPLGYPDPPDEHMHDGCDVANHRAS